ncbi:hypothetical protein K469DRAFT_742127 [Zopfia rhizophila CBS 207.26]|uniref:F-box domain-containing protein n=1 Tax=Zopfia rhizophila CBS 207.26 TaxID=1314779 RepID=A0A6A6DGL7_9PEZI|nr:hypothetical protein K469DRAFT_742127 [Zopfia rhizophila CBS 207.26]
MLSNLPNEILSLVSGYLDTPCDVRNLALTSRRLNEFTKLDGWKAYLHGRFGILTFSDAQESAHGLTTLYRNWDRKAFVARYLAPSENATDLTTWKRTRWRGPQGQTMGYQPHIDSYEETHSNWSSRREVLAWSAGTQLVMRIKETGPKAREQWEEFQEIKLHPEEIKDPEKNERSMGFVGRFDCYKNLQSWYIHQLPHSVEGRDDITALKLLRPNQKEEGFESYAFGTASGRLQVRSINPIQQSRKGQDYETGGRSINSLSLSSSSSPHLVATLANSMVALYPVLPNHPLNTIEPLCEVSPIVPGAHGGRIWSCSFISNNCVAVGLGPSYEPIQIYDVTPAGFSERPTRKFCLDSKFWLGQRDGEIMATQNRNTSIYPIIPLPTGARGGTGDSRVFLSGGYDGIVRLHDMRSPKGFETLFWDPTNDSSIYSLATQGLERVVAGTSMHSMLKVFDLRVPGSHHYHSIPLPASASGPKAQPPKTKVKGTRTPAKSFVSSGWNLFLYPRNIHGQNRVRTHRNRSEDSPIYSISIPSATSPSLYAGVEGAVVGLDFVSILDKHPDPLFSSSISRFEDTGSINVKKSWNIDEQVLNFGMYEQEAKDGRCLGSLGGMREER